MDPRTRPAALVRALALGALAAALALPGCDGALGGKIHERPMHERPNHERPGSRSAAATPERGSRSQPRPGPRRANIERAAVLDTDPEPGSEPAGTPPGGDGTPATAPPELGPPEPGPSGGAAPPPRGRGSGAEGGGGRRGGGRSGGGRSGGGTAQVDLVSAGAGAPGTPGTLSGRVLFDGQPPPRRPITEIATTEDCPLHADTPLTEEVVVTDGRLQNAVVYIRRMPQGYTPPPPPSDPLVLDQRGCLYVPHVSAVQTGRRVAATNADDASHNVHVNASRNEAPNRTVGPGGDPVEVVFERAEKVKFTCDIHNWMSAYVAVIDHPFFAVSGADGTWRIAGVPPGEYELEAWHEKYGKVRSGRFDLGPGGEISVEFTYEP